MFNHTVTIFNHYIEERKDMYKRTIVVGVHWEETQGIKLGNKSVITDDSITLVIPRKEEIMGNYTNTREFNQERSTDDLWTLQSGDYIVKGEVLKDITSINDLKGENYKTIASITDVDYSSFGLNNITVKLK